MRLDHILLSACLAEGLRDAGVIRGCEPSFDWYRSNEVRRLLTAAGDRWARTVLLFPVHTGVRMGEQRAVRWADVDFETRIITIRRSAPKWLVVEKSPKSNRHRRVDLTPELAEALEKIRHGGELVFRNPDGSKLRPGSSTRSCGRRRGRAACDGSSGTSCGTRSRRS